MTEELPSGRLAILWSPEARSELRKIDRQPALSVLHCIDRFLVSRSGDVKKLQPPVWGFRLRCGDYRILFDQTGPDAMAVTGVKNRRDAYRQ